MCFKKAPDKIGVNLEIQPILTHVYIFSLSMWFVLNNVFVKIG